MVIFRAPNQSIVSVLFHYVGNASGVAASVALHLESYQADAPTCLLGFKDTTFPFHKSFVPIGKVVIRVFFNVLFLLPPFCFFAPA